MQRLLSRSLLIQKKFISRCCKVHQYEMILYNEKPQTSLVVRFDEEKNNGQYLPDGVKTIKSNNLKTFYSGHNYYVLQTNSGRINIPVIEERVNSEEAPVITLVDVLKWLAKTPDSDNKDSVQPGARIGRLDAANEAGFFHRTDRSRLKKIKKKIKDKVDDEPTEPKKSE